MRFFEKVEDQFVIKFDHGRLVLASIGAALFVALVFLMGVLVGKALWNHPTETALHMVDPVRRSTVVEPRVGDQKLDFYADVKRPTDEAPPQTELKPKIVEEEGSPTPVTPTVPPPPPLPVPAPVDLAAPAAGTATAATAVAATPAPAAKPAPGAKKTLPPRTITTVATPAPAPVAQETPAPASAKAGYSLQIESYQEKSKAEAARKKLASKGINTEISQSVVGGVKWYRLQANGFSTREAADKYNKEVLKPKGFTGYIISR